MSAMLGGEYLKARDTLKELLHSTRALAGESSITLAESESMLGEDFSRPFRLVCIGAKGVGKTTFIEKLLHIDLSDLRQENDLVTICRPMAYRVFEESEKAFQKCYTRHLKSFEIIEIDAAVASSDALQSLIGRADYVFCLFAAENPWMAQIWDFVEEVYPLVRARLSFILNKVDKRTSTDRAMVLKHVKELAEQRKAVGVPVVGVSATEGIQMDACRERVHQSLNTMPAKRIELRRVYDQALLLLKRIEQAIDDKSRNLAGDQEYLQSIEAQMYRLRERMVSRAEQDSFNLADLLQSELQSIARHTRLQFGVVYSHLALFGKSNAVTNIESFVLNRVIENAESYAQVKESKIRLACRQTWGEMRPYLENRLEIEVGAFDEVSFDQQRDVFTEGMAKATRQALQQLRLRRLLNVLLQSRYDVMRKMVQASLLLIIAASLVGIFSTQIFSWVALLLLGGGFGVLLTSFVYSRKTAATLCQHFIELLGDAAPALRRDLREEYLERIRYYYHGFIPMFEQMKRRIASARQDIYPQQQTASSLYLRFKALEQDL